MRLEQIHRIPIFVLILIGSAFPTARWPTDDPEERGA